MIKLKTVLKERGLSTHGVALLAKISPSDLCQALNGKKTFYRGWRMRISAVLGMSENELFPEYKDIKEVR